MPPVIRTACHPPPFTRATRAPGEEGGRLQEERCVTILLPGEGRRLFLRLPRITYVCCPVLIRALYLPPAVTFTGATCTWFAGMVWRTPPHCCLLPQPWFRLPGCYLLPWRCCYRLKTQLRFIVSTAVVGVPLPGCDLQFIAAMIRHCALTYLLLPPSWRTCRSGR